MVHYALEAARRLAEENISLEVIDRRTLAPLDRAAIIASVRKTGRLLVADEAYLTFGIHGEVIASVTEKAFKDPKTAPRRIGNPGVPVPLETSLEETVLPTVDKIANAAKEMMQS